MKDWKVYIRNIIIVILSVVVFKTLFLTSCFIPSTGMENSLYKGEGIFVGKWSYGFRVPFQSFLGYHRILKRTVEKGDIIVFNNPLPSDTLQSIENCELYISRCVGLPGDTIMLDNQLMTITSEVYSPDSKNLYSYQSSSEELLCEILLSLGIKENNLMGYTSEGNYIRSFSYYEFYLISQRLAGKINFTKLNGEGRALPFVVPKKGQNIHIYPWSANLIKNMIVYHENRSAFIKEDTVYLDGNPIDSYTFSKDYYWVMSDNPVNTNDSRLFGFVPETHIVGKALRIWYPSEKERFMQKIK